MAHTQFIGHTKRAQKILDDPKMIPLKVIDVVTGLFEEPVYELQEYTDGITTYQEFVQMVISSSGPMIYTALKNLDTGEVIGWTTSSKCVDDEFDYNLGIVYCREEP